MGQKVEHPMNEMEIKERHKDLRICKQNLSAIIIDNEKDHLDCMKDWLTLRGVDVFAVGHSGEEVLELFQRYKPDFLILDCQIHHDEFYLLLEIKKISDKCKIIISNCYLDPSIERNFSELGATVLKRSSNTEELFEMIRSREFNKF